jgi:hypothetical protein
MLCRSGIIGELVETTQGIVSVFDQDVTCGIPVKANGAWINALNANRIKNGLTPYSTMGAVPLAERARWKQNIERWANEGKFIDRAYTVKVEGNRKKTVPRRCTGRLCSPRR